MNEQQRDETLICQALDGQTTSREWDELTAMAEHDPSLWRRLAESLRDQMSFTQAVNTAVTIAETIELPVDRTGPRALPVTTRPNAVVRFGAWGGWAVAAVVVIAWAIGFGGSQPSRDQWQPTAGIIPVSSAADAFQAYLDKGRAERLVIGEVPERVLLDSRPAPSGEGYELLYLRQVLERAIVPDLYQFTGQDELGRPTLVRFEQHAGRSM